MVDAASNGRIRSVYAGEKTANSPAVFWFLVAVIGQWAFVYYIVSLCGFAGVQ